MALTLDDIASIYRRKGGLGYAGEPVTQIEHALQTARLAEQAGGSDALVTASLLHDIGHMLSGEGDTPTLRGVDDTHQYFAIPFLRGVFSDEVLEPIRLHVEAKRYLCHARADYWNSLSPDSKRSLELQGGVYRPDEAARFIARPFAADAVRLREWDDLAKVAGVVTPDFAHFTARMKKCALGHSNSKS
jgi:phosphonate degradation associated HDIG domain protein